MRRPENVQMEAAVDRVPLGLGAEGSKGPFPKQLFSLGTVRAAGCTWSRKRSCSTYEMHLKTVMPILMHSKNEKGCWKN